MLNRWRATGSMIGPDPVANWVGKLSVSSSLVDCYWTRLLLALLLAMANMIDDAAIRYRNPLSDRAQDAAFRSRMPWEWGKRPLIVVLLRSYHPPRPFLAKSKLPFKKPICCP